MESRKIPSQYLTRSDYRSNRHYFLILFCGLSMFTILALFVVSRQLNYLVLGLFLLCPLLHLLTVPKSHYQWLNGHKEE